MLECYISSIDYISNSLDGLDEGSYYETFSEIQEFYEILDGTSIAYEFLKTNSFVEDCSSISESLLNKCKACYSLLEEYRDEESQSIDGYRKIVSGASNRRFDIILAEYCEKIEQTKILRALFSECKFLLSQCENELTSRNLLDKAPCFISCKKHLIAIDEYTDTSIDQFLLRVSFAELSETRQILEKLFNSLNAYEKSLLDYNDYKFKLELWIQDHFEGLNVYSSKISENVVNFKTKSFDATNARIKVFVDEINNIVYTSLSPYADLTNLLNKEKLDIIHQSMVNLVIEYSDFETYINTSLSIIKESLIIIEKCDDILIKAKVRNYAKDFLSLRVQILNMKTSGFSDYEEFVSILNIPALEKLQKDLISILIDAEGAKESFLQYQLINNDLKVFLTKHRTNLRVIKIIFCSLIINSKKLKYNAIREKIDNLKDRINLFEIRNLNPYSDFLHEFNPTSIKDSISELVSQALVEIQFLQNNRTKKVLLLSIFIPLILTPLPIGIEFFTWLKIMMLFSGLVLFYLFFANIILNVSIKNYRKKTGLLSSAINRGGATKKNEFSQIEPYQVIPQTNQRELSNSSHAKDNELKERFEKLAITQYLLVKENFKSIQDSSRKRG